MKNMESAKKCLGCKGIHCNELVSGVDERCANCTIIYAKQLRDKALFDKKKK